MSRPGWDAARVASYAVAAGVHLLTLALTAGAVATSLLYPVFPGYGLSLVLLAVASSSARGSRGCPQAPSR